MFAVPMLDLSEPHRLLQDELRCVFDRVISSNRFILGEEVAAFERAVAVFSGVEHAVGVSSGSDALLAMLMALDVGPGDEVVTTPYSFFATVEAIVRLGAKPVFADVDPLTMNLDPLLAAERVGAATKAILAVHLFGRPARLGELKIAARRSGARLLEDAAQAIGASGVGQQGQGAALSFFPSKNLGGLGDGGMVLTNDASFAARIRTLRNHGASAKLEHAEIGGNLRLDELQAALLAVKLPRLQAWTVERRRVAAAYRVRLADLPIALPPEDEGAVWNQYVIRVPADRRASLIEHLSRRGIASAIYYPVPLHLQPALSRLGHASGEFPHAERAAREALALPIYPELSDDGISRVSEALSEFFA
jgi:dTDP-4-amino-4,6-dideoxygalactose transaminase